MAAFDNFASLQKKMESLPPDQLQKYIDGQGAIPQEEQMAALFAQAKRAGLELGEQAKQPVPSGTVAENINHKAVLNHLQDIANKSGMQITGVAPVNAGLGAIPQGAPQAPMTPPVAPSPPPIAPPVAPPAPAPQPAPMPQGMAHGGITHAVPHHMFRFSHGGGIMGFDGTDGSSVNAAIAAVNQAMPEEMPEHTSLTPMQYDQQRAAALEAVKSNMAPAAPRQETYAERDIRMHNAPSLSSYNDPFSGANVSAAINRSSYQPLSSNAGPNVGSPVDAEPATPFPAGYVRHAMANDPRLNVAPPAPTITPAATPNATPAAPTTAIPPQTKPQAGLGALIQNKPSVKPTNKPVEEQKIPGTENNLNYMALEDKQLTEKRDILDEIKKQELVQAHYGLNNPYGIEAEKRAAQLAAMYSKINEEHPYERLLQVLTGIGTGGLAGAAPAYLRSEGAFREAQQAQFDNINKILSPIETARREEARTNASSVLTAYNDTEKERKKNLAEMAKQQLTGEQAMSRENLSQTEETKRNNARIAAENARKVMELNNPNRAINSMDIYNAMKNDIKNGKGEPSLKNKSDAELREAAIAAASGQENKLGFQSINAILNAAIKAHTAALAGYDQTEKVKAQKDLDDAKRMMQNFNQGLDPYAGIATESIEKVMPPPDKLTAYASTHFGGDIEKAKQFLVSQGYK